MRRQPVWNAVDGGREPRRRGAGIEAEQRDHAIDVDEQQGTYLRHETGQDVSLNTDIGLKGDTVGSDDRGVPARQPASEEGRLSRMTDGPSVRSQRADTHRLI
jgi:hypothetical protein